MSHKKRIEKYPLLASSYWCESLGFDGQGENRVQQRIESTSETQECISILLFFFLICTHKHTQFGS